MAAKAMAKAIFIDLRLAQIIIGTILLLVAFLIPDFAGSFVSDTFVPLNVEVKNGNNVTTVGTFINPAFAYPLKDPQVPTSMLVVLSTIIPMALIVISTLISSFAFGSHSDKIATETVIKEYDPSRPAFTKTPAFQIGEQIMDGLSGTLESIAITVLITEILKLACLRPRPNYDLFRKEKAIDAVSSFPSGHSSVAFCSLTYVALVLWRDVGVPMMKRPILHVLMLPLVLVCTSPMWIAVWIAATRVQDFYHHEDDITAGALIGIGCSVMIFRIHKLVPKSAVIVEYESDSESGYE